METSGIVMSDDELELNRFFQQYRAACPDAEAGPHFMPEVWRKVEARRGFLFVFGRLARTSTAAAAALCLLLLLLNLTASPMRVVAPTYTDALAADTAAEIAYLGDRLPVK